MYKAQQTYSYADLINKQTLSDTTRFGISIDKENSYALLQKKKQLQNRESSASSSLQKNEIRSNSGLQKSASQQQFYRASSAIEKNQYQKTIHSIDMKNSSYFQQSQQNGYKQRHCQIKQSKDQGTKQYLQTSNKVQKNKQHETKEYQRLNEKLQNLERKINQLKESYENTNDSCLEKKTDRTKQKQYSLVTKFFNKKPNDTNEKNYSQDEKKVPRDIKQIYNIYNQIKEFKNYSSNTQLLKQSQDKKKLQLQDFVTQIKGSFIKSIPNVKLTNSQQNLNKSDRINEVEEKQMHTIKLSETQPSEKFLYYITTVIQSLTQIQPRRIDEIIKDHFQQTYQGLVYAKGLQIDFSQEKVINLPRSNNLKTIVFDLDETLIHCNESISIQGDVILPITFPNGETLQASINIRPFAQKVLQTLSKHFEIIVFTASHSSYANIVIDYLDPKRQWISHRLYREHCLQTSEGAYVKDLRVLGNRKLSNVLLVDNAAYSFGNQIDNGVPIIAFYDNKDDQELLYLQNYLMNFRYEKDVRILNQKSLKLSQFTNYQDTFEILQNLFALYF